MFRVCRIPPNMTNIVVMLPISAEGNLLLQKASPDLPGSLWDMLSKHCGLLLHSPALDCNQIWTHLKSASGNSLVVQWFGLGAFTARARV